MAGVAGREWSERTHHAPSRSAAPRSRPVKDNAINRLAAALVRVSDYEFPIVTNETTVGFFKAMAPIIGGEAGGALSAFASDPSNMALARQTAATPPTPCPSARWPM